MGCSGGKERSSIRESGRFSGLNLEEHSSLPRVPVPLTTEEHSSPAPPPWNLGAYLLGHPGLGDVLAMSLPPSDGKPLSLIDAQTRKDLALAFGRQLPDQGRQILLHNMKSCGALVALSNLLWQAFEDLAVAEMLPDSDDEDHYEHSITPAVQGTSVDPLANAHDHAAESPGRTMLRLDAPMTRAARRRASDAIQDRATLWLRTSAANETFERNSMRAKEPAVPPPKEPSPPKVRSRTPIPLWLCP